MNQFPENFTYDYIKNKLNNYLETIKERRLIKIAKLRKYVYDQINENTFNLISEFPIPLNDGEDLDIILPVINELKDRKFNISYEKSGPYYEIKYTIIIKS